MFDTRIRKVNGKYVTQYKIKYWATVRKKGLFGIPYTTKELKVVWVDWKTYKKIKYRPISLEEAMFYDDMGF